MQKSNYLRRIGKTGTTGLLTAALAASAAQAALPTGGMMLPRPRGPARVDLPAPTSINTFRVPSETAYGLAGGKEAAANGGRLAVQGDPFAVTGTPAPATAQTARPTVTANAPSPKHPLTNPRVTFADAPQTFPGAEEVTALEARIGVNTLPDAWVDAPSVSSLPESSYAGLKGICPVALRNERRVVQSRPEFFTKFEGRHYEFATAEALAAFKANPEAYAPVLGGRDVVLTASGADDAVGTLKHAGYYRQRLYLFQSDESCETFYGNPRRFVVGE